MILTKDAAKELLEDRIKFKLYAAEHHLNNLRSFKPSSDTEINTHVRRVPWEIEIEGFLFHLIGIKDSFLFQINDKLGLGIDVKDVNLCKTNKALIERGKGGLLKDLNEAMKCPEYDSPPGWLWILNRLRSIGAHRP